MSQPSKTVGALAPAAWARPPYDDLTILVHWASVVLVLAQFATALSIDQAPDPALAARLLLVHRSTGVGVWLLIALRLVWRFTGMRLPPFPPTMARWHIAGVHASEYALYALLLSQPLTGLAWSLYRGRAFGLLFWSVPPLLGRDKALADLFHTLHVAGAVMLAGVVGLHAGAALFHRFVLKDGIFGAMLPRPGRRA
jgi:cytochrome b561